MSTVAITIGQRIRKIRTGKEFNQQDMANKLGITAGAYAKIERGETDPSITRLYNIADILEIDVIILLSDKIDIPNTEVSRKEVEIIHSQISTISKDLSKMRSELNDLKKSPRRK